MSAIWNGTKYGFLERTRKFSFLAMTSLAVLGAFFTVPNPKMPITSIIIEPTHFSQISDPSWIPMATAICAGLFLPLIGVMYCKNAILEDEQTGVLSLIQVSPNGTISYLLGKFFSNLGIMLCILVVITVGSYVMIWVHFFNVKISAYAFLTPYLTIIPGLVFSASVAVLMESFALRFKKTGNGVGNLLFFAYYLMVLTYSILGSKNKLIQLLDFTGFYWLKASIDSIVYPQTGHLAHFTVLAGGDAIQNASDLPVLIFRGVIPSQEFLMDKILLCYISLSLVFLAAVIMPKYEQSTGIHKNKKGIANKQLKKQKIHVVYAGTGIFMEYKMILRNQSILWWIGLIGFWCAAVFAPLTTAQDVIWPLLFGWSFMTFSQMGCREHILYLYDSLRSIKGALTRQCIQVWFCGVLLSLAIVCPILIRMAIAEEVEGICAGVVFSLFIASLALFLGEFTKSSRPFEIAALIFCYLMLNYPPLILGISTKYISVNRIVLFFLLSVAMFSVTLIKRHLAFNVR